MVDFYGKLVGRYQELYLPPMDPKGFFLFGILQDVHFGTVNGC